MMREDPVLRELDRWELTRGPMWDLSEAAHRAGFKGSHGAELISFAYRRKLDLMQTPKPRLQIAPLIAAAIAFIVALVICRVRTG